MKYSESTRSSNSSRDHPGSVLPWFVDCHACSKGQTSIDQTQNSIPRIDRHGPCRALIPFPVLKSPHASRRHHRVRTGGGGRRRFFRPREPPPPGSLKAPGRGGFCPSQQRGGKARLLSPHNRIPPCLRKS